MASDELAERVAGLLGRQRYLGVAMGRAIEATTGLTGVQASTLLAIHDGAERTAAIAEETHQHSSGLSRTIDTLVRSGLVDRRPDPDDRRAIVLGLTDAGHERVDQVLATYRRILAAALDRMDEGQAEAYVETSETFLEAALEEVDAGGP